MPFTEERCSCGCPWVGYDSMEDAENWRRDNWLAALKDSDHDEHCWAWERLQNYIKDKWTDMLDDFFNEAMRDTEYDGKDIIPRTTKEMINMVLEDESFFDCEDCSDTTNGSRCYRNRPTGKNRKRDREDFEAAFNRGS